VKEANLKRQHTAYAQHFDFLKKAKLWRQKDQGLLEIGERRKNRQKTEEF
jgi:hypothetical protein